MYVIKNLTKKAFENCGSILFKMIILHKKFLFNISSNFCKRLKIRNLPHIGGQRGGRRSLAPPLFAKSILKMHLRESIFQKGLEILIAVVFCKECVLPVQGWFLFCKGGRMGGELTEGVGEQKPTLHDQNTTSNPALKTTSTQAF